MTSVSALREKGRNVRWPRVCSSAAATKDETDRQTDRQTGGCTVDRWFLLTAVDAMVTGLFS